MKINRWTFYTIFAILTLSFLASLNTYAATDNKEAEKIQQAISAFNEITDLWHDQKFDEIYDKFADREKSTISKEKFIRRMTNEKKRLACCWQKVQDVKVKLYSSGKAVVSAKFGFEDQPDEAFYVNAEIPLYLKDEGWKVKVKDMLTASPDLPKRQKTRR